MESEIFASCVRRIEAGDIPRSDGPVPGPTVLLKQEMHRAGMATWANGDVSVDLRQILVILDHAAMNVARQKDAELPEELPPWETERRFRWVRPEVAQKYAHDGRDWYWAAWNGSKEDLVRIFREASRVIAPGA